MLKMALFDCAINEKRLQWWRRRWHLPSFFVPAPGDSIAQESSPPGICHPRQKKCICPGISPGGGGGGGGWAQVELTDAFIFGVCFSLRLLSYGDGDPSKPHLNTSCCCFVLFVFVFEKIASQKLTLPEPYLAHFCDCFGTPLLWRFPLVSILNYDWQMF